MTWSNIAFFGSMLFGFIVAISLMLIVYIQARGADALNAIQRNMAKSRSNAYIRAILPIISDAEVARIWRQGNENLIELTEHERVRFFMLLSAFLFARDDASDVAAEEHHETWDNFDLQTRKLLSQPAMEAFWETQGHWHSEAFRRSHRDFINEEAHVADLKRVLPLVIREALLRWGVDPAVADDLQNDIKKAADYVAKYISKVDSDDKRAGITKKWMITAEMRLESEKAHRA